MNPSSQLRQLKAIFGLGRLDLAAFISSLFECASIDPFSLSLTDVELMRVFFVLSVSLLLHLSNISHLLFASSFCLSLSTSQSSCCQGVLARFVSSCVYSCSVSSLFVMSCFVLFSIILSSCVINVINVRWEML